MEPTGKKSDAVMQNNCMNAESPGMSNLLTTQTRRPRYARRSSIMRFTIRRLLVCVAAVALMIAVGLPYLRRVTQPRQCSFVMAANSTPDSFPTTNGYTILDSNDNVRLVALHRLTRKPSGQIGQPDWLDVSLDSQRRPRVYVNNVFVALGNGIFVYYATDQGSPQFQVLPDGAIKAYEFPHQTWDQIVHTDTADEP